MANDCSILIKNKNIEITFLDNQYHKFSDTITVTSASQEAQEVPQNDSRDEIIIKEKTPGADVSTQGFSS